MTSGSSAAPTPIITAPAATAPRGPSTGSGAALTWYDYRFPELHRHYVTLDVQLMLHSFHAGTGAEGLTGRSSNV
jgi:hypothetical protein